MTLIARFWLMLVISILGFMVLGGVGYYGLTTMLKEAKQVEEKETAGVYLYQSTALTLVNTQRALRNLLMFHESNENFESYLAHVKKGTKTAQEQFELAAATMYSDKGRVINETIAKNFEANTKVNDAFITEVSRLRSLAQMRENKQLEADELAALYALADKQQAVFRELDKSVLAGAELKVQRTKESVARVQEATSQITTIFMVVFMLALLALLFVFSLSIAQIKKAMMSFSQGVNQLVAGKLSYRFDATGNDEFSQLGVEMNRLSYSINQSISEANEVLAAVAAGDFSKRMNCQNVGDLETLKVGVNGSAESVAFMMTELEKVMNGLNAGQFNIRMDSRVPHAFRSLVETAMQSMHSVIADINHVMKAMNEGDFDARVNVLAHGDLLSMKNSVNDSMDRLSMAVTGITTIVSAQANGDLTRECTADFRGQLKQLQDAINATSRKLKSIVAQAVDASQIVNEAALQVSQGSSDLSSRVQEQAAALEQTSATMHEMASAVQNNTANARKVADLAHQVQHQAGEGVGVMQQTIGAMQSIHEASSKISDIVSIIDGIAFQTNLLALNAAVEAARAGEHGRGFAVVASEVRALAQKSAEAAKDIKGLIDDSVQRVENGTQLAEKSGSVLNGITASIEQVAGMVEEIATASNEQSTGISQVHNAMADIDRVTQENAALVEETTAAAESLSSEAKDLRESMAFFKTGQQSNAHYHQPKQKQAHKSVKSLPSRRAVPALPAPNSRSANEWSEF